MKTALIILVATVIFCGPAFAQEWLGFFYGNGDGLAIKDDGSAWYAIWGGPAEPAGSIGPGPWVGFGTTAYEEQIYGLTVSGEVWGFFVSPTVSATLVTTLPPGEYCTISPSGHYILGCDGQYWSRTGGNLIGDLNGPVGVRYVPWGNVKATYR